MKLHVAAFFAWIIALGLCATSFAQDNALQESSETLELPAYINFLETEYSEKVPIEVKEQIAMLFTEVMEGNWDEAKRFLSADSIQDMEYFDKSIYQVFSEGLGLSVFPQYTFMGDEVMELREGTYPYSDLCLTLLTMLDRIQLRLIEVDGTFYKFESQIYLSDHSKIHTTLRFRFDAVHVAFHPPLG
jgi:hypothetical protein